jgi:hypothetical protein
MAIDAPTHIRRVDDLLCYRHRAHVAVTVLASHIGTRVRFVPEVDHRALRHVVDLAPRDGLVVTVQLHEGNDRRDVGPLPAVAPRADGHRGQACLILSLSSEVAAGALELFILNMHLMVVRDRLFRRRLRSRRAASDQEA